MPVSKNGLVSFMENPNYTVQERRLVRSSAGLTIASGKGCHRTAIAAMVQDKDPPFSMGKSTMSTGPWLQYSKL